MVLQLDDTQTELLQEVLDSAFRDLRYEIAATDDSSFKLRLRGRHDAVRSILDLVGGPLPDRV